MADEEYTGIDGEYTPEGDVYDADLEGYTPPQILGTDVYRLKVIVFEPQEFTFTPEEGPHAGMEVTRKTFRVVYAAQDAAEKGYTNPQPFSDTLWRPDRKYDDASQLNYSQGKIIKLKRWVGHEDPEGSGVDKKQILGAEFYGMVGTRKKTGKDGVTREFNYVIRDVDPESLV
jgi:hypothetical protein